MTDPSAPSPTSSGDQENPPTDHDSRAARFLAEVIDAGVEVDPVAQQISQERWEIHASVAYDGEIIVAEFDALGIAEDVIEQHAPPASPPVGQPDPPVADPPAP